MIVGKQPRCLLRVPPALFIVGVDGLPECVGERVQFLVGHGCARSFHGFGVGPMDLCAVCGGSVDTQSDGGAVGESVELHFRDS